MSKSRFAGYAWGVLAYNLAVILWGAFVRATVSGDGCGPHWPLCNGEIVPTFASSKRVIEFVHRLSIGVITPLLVVLVVWAFRVFPKKHPVRLGVALCAFFTATEALVGAVLVTKGLVAKNDSVLRTVWMSIHLVNTFLLLASLTLAAWWASGNPGLRLRGQGKVGAALFVGIGLTLLLAVSGAVTALGDTLFPAGSLKAALMQDLSPTANFLIRLRLWHPLIAVSVSVYLVALAGFLSRARPTPEVRRFARWMIGLFLTELAIGGINVLLLAPIPMQLVHLYMADLLWINLILLSGATLTETAMNTAVVTLRPAPDAPALPAQEGPLHGRY